MCTRLRSIAGCLLAVAMVGPLPILPRPAVGQPPPVDDALGRSVDVTAAPFRRVASLVPSATELIVAMGAADRLVARTRYDTASVVSHATSVGEPLAPSRERLVAVRPDLVVAWPRVRAFGSGTRLEELDASLYFARPETMAGMRELLGDLGRLLGREAAADSIGAVLDCRLREAADAVDGRPRVSVGYLIWPEPLFAVGPGSYLDSLIRIAGGRNAFRGATSPWPRVSLESLAGADPDVLLLGSVEAGSPGWRTLRERDVWPALRAVRSDRVHEVPSELFHRPGPQLGRAAAELVRRLHPAAAVSGAEACVPPESPETTGEEPSPQPGVPWAD